MREGEEKRGKPNNKHRIGFLVEPALAITGYKEQGKTEKRVKLHVREFVHVAGLFNVAISRTTHPKHVHIIEGQWPTSLEINLQRLNPFVLEA